MGALLIGSVIAAVYASNAMVVYEKEQKVLSLLEKRRELIKVRDSASEH